MVFADTVGVMAIGLLGTGHCLGMCAPFALGVSAGARGPGVVVARHAAYQLGKGASYAFLGLLLLLATGLAGAFATVERVQTVLAWAAGLSMIALGLAYALEWRPLIRLGEGGAAGRACGALRVLWSSPSLWKSVLIGWVNGFLPCGLTFTALVYLVSFGSAAGVVAGAFLFSLSTLPGLLALGLLGRRMEAAHRRWMVRAAGVGLVLFGALTVVRGTDAVHHWFHRHLVIEATATGDDHAGHDHAHPGH